MYIHILSDYLVCSIVGYFLQVSLYYGEPVGQVKIQELSKNIPRYYTLNRPTRDYST